MRAKRNRNGQGGFTLIELIVVVTIIGILAGIAIVQVKYAQQKAREAALRADLHEMRKAIDDFYADKQRYPSDLKELVPHYLRKIPPDPMTKTDNWEEVQETLEEGSENGATAVTSTATDTATQQQPGVIDVKSKAVGKTLDNVAYKDL